VTETLQLVCFHLAGQEFGAAIHDVRETIGVGPVTPVFHTPVCVAGITNLRGEILAVLDLAALLGLPATKIDEMTRIVVVEAQGRAAGLLVDELGVIRQVEADAIAPAPSTFSSEIASVVRGIIPTDGAPITVIDLERLLDAPILAPFIERPDDDGPTETHVS